MNPLLRQNPYAAKLNNKTRATKNQFIDVGVILSGRKYMPLAEDVKQKQDSTFLKAYMNNPSIIRALSSAPSSSSSTGLFRVPELKDAEGINVLSEKVISRCDDLKMKIENSEAKPIEVLEWLDQMSNALCSLLDTCEFIRNMHTDSVFIDAADSAVENVGKYMNMLNTNKSLYDVRKLQ